MEVVTVIYSSNNRFLFEIVGNSHIFVIKLQESATLLAVTVKSNI